MKLYQNQKVSIVIIARGEDEKFLCTLRSILFQIYKNTEIFLIIPNMTEKWQKAITPYRNNLKLVIQQKGVSKGKVLNNTLKLAEGKYFSVLAAGDIWAPDALEAKVAFLEKNEDNFGVCCDFDIIDKNGIVNTSFFKMRRFFQKETPGSLFVIKDRMHYLIASSFKFFSTLLIRNKDFSFYGPFVENVPGFEFADLLFKMAKQSKLGCINKVLVSRFFDLYKVYYHLNQNMHDRIVSYEHLLASLDPKQKKYENDVRDQIQINYVFWAKYLLKNKEKFEARKRAMDCLNKYSVSPGLLGVMMLSMVPGVGVSSGQRHDYFQVDRLRNDLLKLYY
ncbi:MAG: glycosyltransferase family 2 protein [PVC group bacterium]|nr:glycosyltransferase family 2 protein [PVC group bacterium]